MWRAIFGPKALALSLIAVLAIAVCVDLGRWQWTRKEAVAQINRVLSTNLKSPPTELNEIMSAKVSPKRSERWRRVVVSGTYLPGTHYVRGRSYHAKFGYAVLSVLQVSPGGEFLWVDRGWIAAPGRATQLPIAPPPPGGVVRILARVRGLDSLDSSGIGGALFALPFKHPERISTYILQHRSAKTTVNGYVEMIASTPAGLNQPVPLDAPDITPGPHFAYAVQWFLFALLFLIGRYLIGRDEYLSGRKENETTQRSAN